MKKFRSIILSLFLVCGICVGCAFLPTTLNDSAAANDNISSMEISPDSSWEGSGTEDDPYIVSTPEQLAGMSLEYGAYSEIDGAYFIQNEDIDLGMDVWTPINFKGHFDGNGYQISGFYLNDDAYEGAGLFGKVYGNSTIENINLSGNMEVNQEYFMLEDDSIGGVAGLIGTIYLDGSGDVLISNCAVDVEIYGNNSPFVAGVVGMINAEESTDS